MGEGGWDRVEVHDVGEAKVLVCGDVIGKAEAGIGIPVR